MDKQTLENNLTEVHQIYKNMQSILNGLAQWISEDGPERQQLDDFLDTLKLGKNDETRFIASQRLGNWKFEPLDVYLEKQGKTQEERDTYFESSYIYTRKYIEKLQQGMLGEIREKELVSDFYMMLLEETHELGKLFSDMFLQWNRKLLFGVNRDLESRFENDSDAIMQYLEENDLFDLGHNNDRADRSYSILEADGEWYKKLAYADILKPQMDIILQRLDTFIQKMQKTPDEVYDKQQEFVEYYSSLRTALAETDTDRLVEKWSEVDVKWMAIDTPFQPAHPIEAYEDKYRKAVSIEIDIRIVNPDLFTSSVQADVENMYESFFDEIGRDGEFTEAYEFSLKSMKQVQLYLWVPYLSYGSFLCGMYSAQVVPNDAEVSKVHGKKIFAFPEFVLEGYRNMPFMKLDNEVMGKKLLTDFRKFLHGPNQRFYEVYDVETIGHEFGHTLWLAPDSEVTMNRKTGLFKNIEEFKATAWGMVAYFMNENKELREDIVTTCLTRNIKMMRYREVEEIIPYYCECLISLHIFYSSGIISIENGKIELNMTDATYTSFKETYTGVYSHLIHTYLNKKDASEFLYEYVEKVDGVFLPKEKELRGFVGRYYTLYKEIGNEVDETAKKEDYLF